MRIGRELAFNIRKMAKASLIVGLVVFLLLGTALSAHIKGHGHKHGLKEDGSGDCPDVVSEGGSGDDSVDPPYDPLTGMPRRKPTPPPPGGKVMSAEDFFENLEAEGVISEEELLDKEEYLQETHMENVLSNMAESKPDPLPVIITENLSPAFDDDSPKIHVEEEVSGSGAL